jgi:hypothetical protein
MQLLRRHRGSTGSPKLVGCYGQPPDLDHLQARRQDSVHQAAEPGLVRHRAVPHHGRRLQADRQALAWHSDAARTESLRRPARQISMLPHPRAPPTPPVPCRLGFGRVQGRRARARLRLDDGGGALGRPSLLRVRWPGVDGRAPTTQVPPGVEQPCGPGPAGRSLSGAQTMVRDPQPWDASRCGLELSAGGRVLGQWPNTAVPNR